MAAAQPKPQRDYIDGWADEMIEEIEESLAKHADFDEYCAALDAAAEDSRPIP